MDRIDWRGWLTIAAVIAAGALLVETVIAHRGDRPADPALPLPITHALPGGMLVHEFRAADGTPCVASSAGGVACAWLWEEPGEVPGQELGHPGEPATK